MDFFSPPSFRLAEEGEPLNCNEEREKGGTREGKGVGKRMCYTIPPFSLQLGSLSRSQVPIFAGIEGLVRPPPCPTSSW